MRKALIMMLTLALSLACCLPASAAPFVLPWGTPDQAARIARDALIARWKTIYTDERTQSMFEGHTGYLEVRGTRVFCVAAEPAGAEGDDRLQSTVDNYFGDVAYIVEFSILADYFGTEPYYFHPGTENTVVLYRSGEIAIRDPFRLYAGRTYSWDFTGIIDDVIDFRGDFNGVWRLLGE